MRRERRELFELSASGFHIFERFHEFGRPFRDARLEFLAGERRKLALLLAEGRERHFQFVAPPPEFMLELPFFHKADTLFGEELIRNDAQHGRHILKVIQPVPQLMIDLLEQQFGADGFDRSRKVPDQNAHGLLEERLDGRHLFSRVEVPDAPLEHPPDKCPVSHHYASFSSRKDIPFDRRGGFRAHQYAGPRKERVREPFRKFHLPPVPRKKDEPEHALGPFRMAMAEYVLPQHLFRNALRCLPVRYVVLEGEIIMRGEVLAPFIRTCERGKVPGRLQFAPNGILIRNAARNGREHVPLELPSRYPPLPEPP